MTTKRILIIEREYGAGASVIAERAAQRLGWKLYDHALTEEIAKLAQVHPEACKKKEERMDPWLYRLAKVFWRGSHERSVQFAESGELDADCLIRLTEKVVTKLAETGNCVIVGRAAVYFLRNRPDTFCVFLFGSRDVKYHRVLADVKNEAEAVELVDNVDVERREFIKHYFGADWPSRHLYHAMLNTDIGEEATVDLILHLMDFTEKKAEGAKA
jgi:cytidylate kinase